MNRPTPEIPASSYTFRSPSPTLPEVHRSYYTAINCMPAGFRPLPLARAPCLL